MNSGTAVQSEPSSGVTTLAFRAKNLSHSERELLEAAQRRQVYLLLAVPVTLGVGHLLSIFSLGMVMPILTLVSIIAIAMGILFFKRWTPWLVVLPLWLIGGVLLSSIASWLFVSRTTTTAVLSAAVIVLFAAQGSMPLAFYREWLLTDPRMDDQARREGSLPRLRPQWLVLLGVLALVIFVPLRHSTSLAIILVIVLSVGVLAYASARHPLGLRAGLRSLLREGRFMQHLFLAYPDASDTEPGCWKPRWSRTKRKVWSTLFMGSTAMVLVVGLSFCCPWELVASLTSGEAWWQIPPEAERRHGWLLLPLRPLGEGGSPYVWVFVVGFVLIFTLPSLVLLAVYAPALLRLRQAFEKTVTAGERNRTDWDVYVDRLRHSTHAVEDPETGDVLRESDHLFMGVYQKTKGPVLLHRRILDEHMYIAGQTGAGKTSLGIIPILTQLIRSGGDRPCPILILDLKGDLTLFNTAREEAASRTADGRPAPQELMLFRTDQGYATHYFNPFRDFASTSPPRRPIETAELFIQALSLFHGDFYGASYYSKQHRDVLLSALDAAKKRKSELRTFDDLYEAVKNYVASAGDRGRDAVELLATIHAVSQYEQLGPAPAGVGSIHMPELIRKGQLAYFWLPSQLTGMTVRETGKLALYAFLTAMQEYRQSGEAAGDDRRGYLIIDEFQRIAAENLRVILQQARSFGISVILANQVPSDLKLPSADLRSTVYTNTRVKQFFSITDPRELDALSKLSGEEPDWLQQESETSDGTWRNAVLTKTTGRKQILRARFRADEARLATDAPNDSVLYVSRGRGYTQLQGIPQSITTPWPTTLEVYMRRLETPWPRVNKAPGTAANTSSPDDHEVVAAKRSSDFMTQLEATHGRLGEELFGTPPGEQPPRPGPKGKDRGRGKRDKDGRHPRWEQEEDRDDQ